MTTEENKAVVRRFYEAFGAGDTEALTALLSPDLVAYSHAAPGPQNRDTHVGGIAGWLTMFSDNRFTIKEQVAEGDLVATRMIFRAVHSLGEFMGLAPSGKQIEIEGISLERVRDGRIVERRASSDWHGMLQQLGLAPTPETH